MGRGQVVKVAVGQGKGIVITGASAGIGRALAEAMAAPGVCLGLIGRDQNRLRAVAAACKARGAEVSIGEVDVTDFDALEAWLSVFDLQHPVALVIANAGVTAASGEDGALESRAEALRLIDINWMGVVNTVYAVMPAMRRRGHGQIALVSSLTAWRGMALTPAYSATKAAVKAYGEALRDLLAPVGIRVSVVCPGFVETGMSNRFPGPRPRMIAAQQAAERIVRGLQRDEPCIAFPWSMAFGMRLLAVLPFGMGAFFLRVLALQPRTWTRPE